MAYIVTAKILVDEINDLYADSIVHKLLEQFVGGDIIDFSTERVAPCNTVIDDSITNETYAAGDFTQSWVIYSEKEAEKNGEGYWSDECGWTCLDLATIYDSENVKLPSDSEDAVLIMRNSVQF